MTNEAVFDVENFVDCARYGEIEDMHAIIAAYVQASGANPDDKDVLRALVTKRSESGYTALHVAAANGEVAVLFLSAGADAILKNDDGRTGHLNVVNMLLKSFEPGEDVTGGENSADAPEAADE
ncbi:hypothetical protein BC829DRAFT_397888, partial [Chytridium lagenaria]